MKLVKFLLLITLGWQLNAANFYIYNASASETVDGYIYADTKYRLTNFRVRLVANEIHGANKSSITTFLNLNQQNLPKVFIPSLLTESSTENIFDSHGPTNKVTLIVTADGYTHYDESTKFLLFSEDLLLNNAIESGDTLRITLKNISLKDNLVKLDYVIQIKRKNQSEFVPIEKIVGTYISLC